MSDIPGVPKIKVESTSAPIAVRPKFAPKIPIKADPVINVEGVAISQSDG